MIKSVRMFLAILRGDAVVLIRKDTAKADVVVGKRLGKQFAVSSMVGAIKVMML